MTTKAPTTKQNTPIEKEPVMEQRPRVQQPKKVSVTHSEAGHGATRNKKLSRYSPMRVLRGEFLADAKTIKYIPFVLFLTALALVYIANAYYVERKVVKIQKLNKRVKDLHTNYVSVKADLMFSMKQTEIATKLAESGLKESVTPPNVIRINEKGMEIY